MEFGYNKQKKKVHVETGEKVSVFMFFFSLRICLGLGALKHFQLILLSSHSYACHY